MPEPPVLRAAPARLPHVNASFSAAAHLLYTQAYTDHRVSFYCGCASAAPTRSSTPPWNNADPPDAWEIERDRRISRIQGRGNRYVEHDRRFIMGTVRLTPCDEHRFRAAQAQPASC